MTLDLQLRQHHRARPSSEPPPPPAAFSPSRLQPPPPQRRRRPRWRIDGGSIGGCLHHRVSNILLNIYLQFAGANVSVCVCTCVNYSLPLTLGRARRNDSKRPVAHCAEKLGRSVRQRGDVLFYDFTYSELEYGRPRKCWLKCHHCWNVSNKNTATLLVAVRSARRTAYNFGPLTTNFAYFARPSPPHRHGPISAHSQIAHSHAGTQTQKHGDGGRCISRAHIAPRRKPVRAIHSCTCPT